MNGLVLFHCDSNTGYAIDALERAFASATRRAFPDGKIFLAYRSLASGPPENLRGLYEDVTQAKYRGLDSTETRELSRWIRSRHISFALAFDLPVKADVLVPLREGGVRSILSYWGAPISSVFPWYLRPARRAQYLLSKGRPDHFVFESEGMRDGAVRGSCIPRSRTSVCRLGVDTQRFRPDVGDADYIFREFAIPRHRSIVMFSGHMEHRKGVHILIEAFSSLVEEKRRDDLQLVLVGNFRDDFERLVGHIRGPFSRDRITFAGYRHDVERLHHGVSIGVVPSCGWDSFTMSACEYAASGVPLIVTNLPGLSESVVPEETGLLVEPDSPRQLAQAIERLADNEALRRRMGSQARYRAISELSAERQIVDLSNILKSVVAS